MQLRLRPEVAAHSGPYGLTEQITAYERRAVLDLYHLAGRCRAGLWYGDQPALVPLHAMSALGYPDELLDFAWEALVGMGVVEIVAVNSLGIEVRFQLPVQGDLP